MSVTDDGVQRPPWPSRQSSAGVFTGLPVVPCCTSSLRGMSAIGQLQAGRKETVARATAEYVLAVNSRSFRPFVIGKNVDPGSRSP
jgi:hypothetical protein